MISSYWREAPQYVQLADVLLAEIVLVFWERVGLRKAQLEGVSHSAKVT